MHRIAIVRYAKQVSSVHSIAIEVNRKHLRIAEAEVIVPTHE